MSKINLILKKELRTTLRDKKALITILLPILIYPVIMIFFIGFSSIVQSNLNEVISIVAIDEKTPSSFLSRLEDDPKIDVVIRSVSHEQESFESEEINASITFEGEQANQMFTIFYNSANDASQQAVDRLSKHLKDYNSFYKHQILEEAGINYEFENIVSIYEEDISGDIGGRIIAMVLGMLLPLIIVLYGITGTYTISSDLSAGEKERETLETIFSVPVKRFEIITGKLWACVIVGLISGMVNIFSLLPLVYLIVANIPGLNISISIPLIMYLFLMLIPVMILTSAIFIGLGFFVKTYQESQSYGSLLFIAFMALCYIPMIPNLELTKLTLSIPITNSMMLMKEAFLGSYSLLNTLMVLGINLAVSLLGIVLMNKVFKSDWVIFGGGN